MTSAVTVTVTTSTTTPVPTVTAIVISTAPYQHTTIPTSTYFHVSILMLIRSMRIIFEI